MTASHAIMLVIGLVTLAAGLTTLLKPSITRTLLGMQESEAATYVLRMGGMMSTAFGLVLVLFVAAFTATPGATNSMGV